MADNQISSDLLDTAARPRTPSLPTPVGSKTPPTISTKRFLDRPETTSAVQRATEAMEADALQRRLREIENAGRPRDRTPGRSPSRKRQRVYGDR